MKKFLYLTILAFCVILPGTVFAQSHNPNAKKNSKKKPTSFDAIKPQGAPVNQSRLDEAQTDPNDPNKTVQSETSVIWEEYDDPLIDGDEDDPYAFPTYEEVMPFVYGNREDEGAESEDEILMAGDSTMIHSPKLDLRDLSDPVTLQLTNPQEGEMFVFPTPELGRPTSHFGPRRRRFHYGLDLAMPQGQPIYAAFDGVVRFSQYNRSYGNLIVVRHENGLETYYAHLSKRHVSPGTRVKAGDIIGLCGNTGRSYGSHLHFEIRYQGNAMNPENVISCETRTLLSPTLTLTRDSFRKVSKPGTAYQNGRSKGRSRSSNYSGDGKYYRVRSGDTLGRIAQRNGTTVRRLCQLNGISETSLLQIGQKIRLR